MSMVGHMTSSEVCVYRTSSVWLMLSSGLVFHNLLPPLALLLKGLKAEKISSAYPVRLLLSNLPFFFPIIIIYLFILLNQFPLSLPMTSVRAKVNSTVCDPT